MSGKVHRLTDAGPIIEPPAEVVDKLRDLLARAERGEIKGLGFFVVSGADTVFTGWAAGCARSGLMVTGAALLQHRVIAADLDE